VLDALASLLAVLHTECRIPLTRPFPDAMPPLPWAVESFSRRHAGKWGKVAGWYGHIEIPENSHWDPGAYKWKELLAAAKSKLTPQPPVPTPKPKRRYVTYWGMRVRVGSKLYKWIQKMIGRGAFKDMP
jgi:hypothetical protein